METFGTPFSIVGCIMKEKEKKMYTLLLLLIYLAFISLGLPDSLWVLPGR